MTRTRTASQALLNVDEHLATTNQTGQFVITHIGGLHRRGTWPRAVIVGEPSPWDWHRILSGLAPVVDVLTLGEQSARGCARQVEATRNAQDHWGSTEVRGGVGCDRGDPPQAPGASESSNRAPVVITDGGEYVPEPDPFEPLSSLLDLDPLDIGGEGPARGAARQTDHGEWTATVPAMEVVTDRGRLLLEVGKPIDVREGQKIEERPPEQLQPGSILLVGRRQRRVGLLEALEERLGHRPDLIASRYLLDDYRRRVRARLADSGMTVTSLHRAMADLGCARTLGAVRSWATEGRMAPQQFEDLEYLNRALGLGLSVTDMRELFAGVQRRRGFRRAAGRALAAAARDALVIGDERIDPESGLTVADLREAVIEATVMSVTMCDQPVPLTLLGTLEDQ